MTILFSWCNENVHPRDSEDFNIYYDSEKDQVHWSQYSLWEPAIMDKYEYTGDCPGQEWLHWLGTLYSEEKLSNGSSYGSSYKLSIKGAISQIGSLCRDDQVHHVFLDSFSIIENGEKSRRIDRVVKASPCQAALLRCVSDNPSIINNMTPREFEVVVAHTIKAAGFSKVQLRRYSKDSGVDILAIHAFSRNSDELVVIEAKHGKSGITLSVLDRLNGVRDRLTANRALAVSSAHVTGDARSEYQAQKNYIAAYTYKELMSILNDSDDWSKTPHGLWSKM